MQTEVTASSPITLIDHVTADHQKIALHKLIEYIRSHKDEWSISNNVFDEKNNVKLELGLNGYGLFTLSRRANIPDPRHKTDSFTLRIDRKRRFFYPKYKITVSYSFWYLQRTYEVQNNITLLVEDMHDLRAQDSYGIIKLCQDMNLVAGKLRHLEHLQLVQKQLQQAPIEHHQV